MLLDNARYLSNSSEHSPRSMSVVTLPPNLPADEVHGWLTNLNDYSADSLKPLLAEDELSRAARFHFERDRNHFIVARAWLRKLLATYLDADAAKLQFSYAEKG